MQDKIVMVTGGTAGIGLVTAREIASKGATVILVGRDETRGERAAADIRKRTGNAWVSFKRADLSSQAEVRRLARDFVEAHPQLDVLVNNAGAIFTERRLSADGIEMTLALNHLSYFLLTHLLLDRLTAAPAGRIVNVASRAHEGAALDFDDLQGERNFTGWRAYQRSKLMNIMFTYALARRLAGGTVTANALHPGFVASSFGMNNGALFRIGLRIAMTVGGISVDRGAETPVFLATSPECANVSGRYFVKSKPVTSSRASLDETAQERLWQESLRMTGLRDATG
ncbi:MAG: SDR family oxidoreductase [Alphaproteobacteria bacterium]